MPILQLDHLAILESALTSRNGLLLRVSDFTRARAALYAARAASGDSRFAVLQIRTSHLPDGDLLLVRGEPPGPKGPSAQKRSRDLLAELE